MNATLCTKKPCGYQFRVLNPHRRPSLSSSSARDVSMIFDGNHGNATNGPFSMTRHAGTLPHVTGVSFLTPLMKMPLLRGAASSVGASPLDFLADFPYEGNQDTLSRLHRRHPLFAG